MSDIKTGLMFSPLTKRVYWGRVNTKTGFSVGNSQKDITSEFIGTMLQKFPINTSQNVTSNGKTECVVIVLDEEKAKEYTNAKEENAQLKNQLHDLFEHVTGVSVSEYKLEQMPYLADYLIGQAEADDSCINKLKADKAELIAFVESVANCHAIIGIGDEDVSDKGRARKLLNKHKEQSNGN